MGKPNDDAEVSNSDTIKGPPLKASSPKITSLDNAGGSYQVIGSDDSTGYLKGKGVHDIESWFNDEDQHNGISQSSDGQIDANEWHLSMVDPGAVVFPNEGIRSGAGVSDVHSLQLSLQAFIRNPWWCRFWGKVIMVVKCNSPNKSIVY
jgi:hypothetical protein